MNLLIAVLLCYLLGSIPSAYVVGRLNGIDIFAVGSGNMGATNVSRTLGFRWGAVVAVTDVLKGVFGVLLARAVVPEDPFWAGALGGMAVIFGHDYSMFATLLTRRIRGGKGAATSAGTWIVLFAPWPYLVLGPLLLFVTLIFSTRIVSLSVLATGLIALAGAALGALQTLVPTPYVVYAVFMAALLFYRHHENIDRLLRGKERRLGDRA